MDIKVLVMVVVIIVVVIIIFFLVVVIIINKEEDEHQRDSPWSLPGSNQSYMISYYLLSPLYIWYLFFN